MHTARSLGRGKSTYFETLDMARALACKPGVESQYLGLSMFMFETLVIARALINVHSSTRWLEESAYDVHGSTTWLGRALTLSPWRCRDADVEPFERLEHGEPVQDPERRSEPLYDSAISSLMDHFLVSGHTYVDGETRIHDPVVINRS